MKDKRMIAEFMGVECKLVDGWYGIYYPNDEPTMSHNCDKINLVVWDRFLNLSKYDSSWDWIIPVWHKFRTLVWDNKKLSSKYDRRHNEKQFNNVVSRNAPKEAFGLLVEAIKWYNKQRYMENTCTCDETETCDRCDTN